MLIQVDEQDVPAGTIGKMAAHRDGVLHRALSVFIFNSRGEWLLQQRATSKYHSGGLWSNACCSHPRPGETTEEAAHRRLLFEMGMRCTLSEVFSFVYRTEFPNGLIEHEYDHVFIGITDEQPRCNPGEVQDWKYCSFDRLEKEIRAGDQQFTAWFIMVYRRVQEAYSSRPGKYAQP